MRTAAPPSARYAAIIAGQLALLGARHASSLFSHSALPLILVALGLGETREHAAQHPAPVAEQQAPAGNKPSTVRIGRLEVNGPLPPDVIQRIIRLSYGRLRICLEQGLNKNPYLEGSVNVRFVIGRDGNVSNAANGGSDLSDRELIDCVVDTFFGLQFPKPQGGIVLVQCPISMSHG